METNFSFEVDVRLALTPKNSMRSCVFVFGNLSSAREFADNLLLNVPGISVVIYRYKDGALDGLVETLGLRPLQKVYYKRLHRHGK